MPPHAPSSTWPRRVALALCVVAALRVLLVVAPAPMRGYANNYDFIRVAAWFDLWPVAPPGATRFDPLAQHPSAPLRCHRVDPAITSDTRYASSDLALVWLALRVNDAWRAVSGPSACPVDLRVVGLLRAALLLAAGLATTWLFLRRAPAAGVASALLLAVVLSDPAVSLTMNTLYGEFAVILFTYVAGAGLVYAIGYAAFGVAPGALLGAALLALACTKTQYAALPVALVAVLALGAACVRGGTTRSRRVATLLLATAGVVAGLALQRSVMSGGSYMWASRMATATDTFFGAVLPLHADPDRALRLAGLPERCRPYVGRTWYDEGMQPPPCPEVADVARARILLLLADDPMLGVRLARRALPLLQPIVIRAFGQVEGLDYAQADALPRSGIVSVSTLVEALPKPLFAALVAFTLLVSGVAVADLVRGGTDAALPALVLVCAAVEAYAFASALFGDGFVGLARHALVGQLAFVVQLGAGTAQIVRVVRRGRATGRAAAYSV